jgi:putative PIN family toxin of toxin-antitoxin system
MIVVIDTNVIISALIRDSLTRKVIIESGLNFVYPEISLHELRKHKKTMVAKSGLTERDIDTLLDKLLEYVVLIPVEAVRSHLDEARLAMQKIDPNDVVFVASALAFKNAVIWSDDRDFERQKRIRVVKTVDFARVFVK